MINFFISIIAAVIGIILVIAIHELGHFCFAKCLGVKVLRFSIGFGRPLWKRMVKGTEYVVGMFPIGGYVRLLDERENDVSPEERHLAFNRQVVWKRCLIIFAGPFFNLLLAWLAFWLVFVSGIYLITPKIGEIVPGSIAEKAGLKAYDRIIQIDDQKVMNWGTVIAVLAMKYGETKQITVSVIPSANMTPTQHVLDLKQWSLDNLHPSLMKSLGIVELRPKSVEKDSIYFKLPLIQAIGKSLKQVGFYIYFNLVILWKVLMGVLSLQSLSGPIGLFLGFFAALKQGFLTYVLFLGWLSINLAVINLLPIPGLDGSHIVYTFIEGIFKKPISIRVQVLAYRLGVIVLVFLMIQVIANDLLRLLT